MDNRLAAISPSTPLAQYCAGAQQRATRKVTEFLAPTVPVETAMGRFAVWAEKQRFSLPHTVRAIKGRAMMIELAKLDATYDCTPHAVDVPVDKAVGEDLDRLLRDGVDLGTDIEGLVHLYEVVTKAKAAAGAGEDKVYDANTDPVEFIDAAIRTVRLASKAEGIAVLFGDGAWTRFKNHPLVSARCKGGPDFETHPGLFSGRAEYMSCHAVYDANDEGLDEDIQFLLDNEILIFSRSPLPTRRDPSFMKTFRLQNYKKKNDSWEHRDGRVVFASVDWVSDTQVTNEVGVLRINYNAAS